jgi:prevent-host-death family protein
MAEATVRQLRNQGGDILDRVAAGERITVTRDGRAVARVEPLGRRPLSATSLIERFRRLPRVDARALRADVDTMLDQAL